MDQGPLCTSGTVITEHTVDWRCASSVVASGCLRVTEDDTTLWEEPVSTTKSRRGPWPKRTATLSDTSPRAGVTVSGTVVPFSPCVSAVVVGSSGLYRARTPRAAHLGSGQDEGPRLEIDADPAEAGKDVGAEQANRLALPPHLGQRGCRQLLRRQLDTVE